MLVQRHPFTYLYSSDGYFSTLFTFPSLFIVTALCLATTCMKSALYMKFIRSNLYSSYVQEAKVAKIIIHEDYNSVTKQHDIALLKLQTPLVFDECVRPVPVWSRDSPSLQRCTVTGWGSTTESRYLPCHLQQANTGLENVYS